MRLCAAGFTSLQRNPRYCESVVGRSIMTKSKSPDSFRQNRTSCSVLTPVLLKGWNLAAPNRTTCSVRPPSVRKEALLCRLDYGIGDAKNRGRRTRQVGDKFHGANSLEIFLGGCDRPRGRSLTRAVQWAMAPGVIPFCKSNVAPTAPTGAVCRVKPRLRRRYIVASMPVQ